MREAAARERATSRERTARPRAVPQERVAPQSQERTAPRESAAETIDLSKLSDGPHASHASSTEKAFKVYFDLALYSLSGVTTLTFANFHSFLFLDVLPDEKVQFSFDVSSARGSPTFYELDWQALPWLQLRLGKIWIPFDDLSPHNLFGGRVNVSTLAPPGTDPFLPDLWTDLGVGVKFDLIERRALKLVSHLYVVNGFQDGGQDPVNPGNPYPSFAGTGTLATDNNQDKAIGGRVHALIAGKLGLGGSFFTGRWNDKGESESHRATIVGADVQLKLQIAQIRAGVAAMRVGIPGDAIRRGGFYGEFGVPMGEKWKLLARGGSVQQDDRVLAVTDRTILGGSVIYRPSFVQLQAEYSRDVKERAGKVGEEFVALRTVIEL